MKYKNIISIIGVILLILFPVSAKADGSNDFTANLSVSDTSVPAGTTVTSTITVTNTDSTYGADIAISYGGQSIASYYLGAGATTVTTHNITINQTQKVSYTVYASHGPDISKTKYTNAVTVYVENPATDTPAPTHTHTPVPTETATPTPIITEEITPEVTLEPIPADDTLGWGNPIHLSAPNARVMDNVFDESLGTWLGVNAPEKSPYDDVYPLRRIVAAIASFLALSIVAFAIFAVRLYRKNKS